MSTPQHHVYPAQELNEEFLHQGLFSHNLHRSNIGGRGTAGADGHAGAQPISMVAHTAPTSTPFKSLANIIVPHLPRPISWGAETVADGRTGKGGGGVSSMWLESVHLIVLSLLLSVFLSLFLARADMPSELRGGKSCAGKFTQTWDGNRSQQ